MSRASLHAWGPFAETSASHSVGKSFKYVAFPDAPGDRRASRVSPGVPAKAHSRSAKPQVATGTHRQSPSHGNVPRHHRLALPHRRKKTPPHHGRKAGSAP